MPDLSIKYNDQVIGTLDTSGTATLKTANKKCVSDIEVEYTKSGSDAPAGNILNITNNTGGTPPITGQSLITPDGANCVDYPFNIPAGISKLYVYNGFERGDVYTISFHIVSTKDAYSVVVNNTPLVKDSEGYPFRVDSINGPITGQTYNVVITDR